jgi:hypothetical protein
MASRPRGEQVWDVSGHRDQPAPRPPLRSSATGSGCRWGRISGPPRTAPTCSPSTRPGQARRPWFSDRRTASDSPRRTRRDPSVRLPRVSNRRAGSRSSTRASTSLTCPTPGPDDNNPSCRCRKPNPGNTLAIRWAASVDPSHSPAAPSGHSAGGRWAAPQARWHVPVLRRPAPAAGWGARDGA